MTLLTQDDELLLSLLHAARFAELVRLLICDDIKYSMLAAPDFYAKLSSNLSVVSDEEIEKAALPLMRGQVSIDVARAALKFFSSPVGSAISRKLVGSQPPQFTHTESAALAEFGGGAEGAAFSAFLGDPLVLTTVTETIKDYAA